MKIGDRVKVIEVDEFFDSDSNLELGYTGIITLEFFTEPEPEVEDDCFGIKFDKEIIPGKHCKLNYDGSYDMFRSQLEVIEKEESH